MISEPYVGNEQLPLADGSGLPIQNIQAVYMVQPTGFEDQKAPGLVFRLHKVLAICQGSTYTNDWRGKTISFWQ